MGVGVSYERGTPGGWTPSTSRGLNLHPRTEMVFSSWAARLPQLLHCEDRIGTGLPRARTEVIYVDLGYWAISGSIHPEMHAIPV
jgi:hypothetical protein